jgi:cytidine deaminase
MEFSYVMVDGLRVYDIPDAICEDLLRQVEAARPHSYPLPDKVAAVTLTARGTTYAGVSYHTGVMALTMHAEATALAHAAIHGDKELVAITGPNCHACKQLIWESSINAGIDMVVVMRQGDQLLKVPISRMMQFAWPENHWRDTTP